MSTQFTNRQWRLPNNENKAKQSNYSMDFDGSSYIDVEHLNLTGAFSLSFWANYTTTGNGINIISQNQTSQATFGMYQLTDGKIRFWVTSSGSYNASNEITANTATNNGNWNNIILINDGTNLKIYINGSLDNSSSNGVSSPYNGTANFWIGGSQAGGAKFEGKLDSVSIYNYALSSSQITTLYGSSSTGIGNPMSLSPKPVFYAPLGDQDSFNGADYLVPNIAAQEDDGDIAVSYSPYALDFDGANDYIDLGSDLSLDIAGNDFSCSLWFNTTTTGGNQALFALEAFSNKFAMTIEGGSAYKNVGFSFNWNTGGGSTYYYNGGNNLTDGNWHNYIITKQGTTVQAYIDGSTITFGNLNGGAFSSNANRIARWYHGYYSGKISNISLWNKQLSSSEVTEIYSEGIPQNLNNHSAYSNLVSWWQLGSNTSWVDPYWIALDEKGTNNGQSQNVAAPNNMGESAIVDGVGSYANGLSSGMGGDEVIGDAPYSTSNSLSVNMDVLDRVTDTPS